MEERRFSAALAAIRDLGFSPCDPSQGKRPQALKGIASEKKRGPEGPLFHWSQRIKQERPAGCYTCEPPGGLFGIDQEVVTLKRPDRLFRRDMLWPLRLTPGSRCDLNTGQKSNSPVELRSTQSNRSKSQPPHLVSETIYFHQNLSSDHLLSGVIRD